VQVRKAKLLADLQQLPQQQAANPLTLGIVHHDDPDLTEIKRLPREVRRSKRCLGSLTNDSSFLHVAFVVHPTRSRLHLIKEGTWAGFARPRSPP